MNIPELREKIKLLQERLNTREIYTILLILVVGFCSFGLGRLSKLQEGKSGIRIEQTSAAILSSPTPLQRGEKRTLGASQDLERPSSDAKGVQLRYEGTESSRGSEDPQAIPVQGLPAIALAPGGQYVASKGGTKYYFPWCGSAARISEANKIWFNSVEEARKAGYTPASNCKGLK
ncbi:MAG: hypothetical protein EXS51_01885 [Candidatus Taylorbacteria bacterium]|nr:hypothetical protein [Candidatus Taylorbacteria bacterium]